MVEAVGEPPSGWPSRRKSPYGLGYAQRMTSELETSVRGAEAALAAAQLAQDVDALDPLLHDEVVWTGPDGTVGGKAEDLNAHRERLYTISALNVRELDVDLVTEGTAVTRALVDVESEPPFGTLRYTRVWVHENGRWQVRVAHLGVVAGT